MRLVVIDNGSLEPAATLNLRRMATELQAAVGRTVVPVSWKHSDRIPPGEIEGGPGRTLEAFVREEIGQGRREFVFVPFFISAQGAIGSALRRDLERLQASAGPFSFGFTRGLAELGLVARIAAERIREAVAEAGLRRPPVVLVDHGGPSPRSARLRDELARDVARELGDTVGSVTAASMEGEHPPLLADVLHAGGHAGQDVVVGQLFLSPGRHAGPGGDIAAICAAAPARSHRSGLIGTHPLATTALASALHEHLRSTQAAPSSPS